MQDDLNPSSVQTWIQIFTNFGVTNAITWGVAVLVYRYAIKWFVDSNKRQLVSSRRERRILQNHASFSRVAERLIQHFAQKAESDVPSDVIQELHDIRNRAAVKADTVDEDEDSES